MVFPLSHVSLLAVFYCDCVVDNNDKGAMYV
jgi:hypothetical protein